MSVKGFWIKDMYCGTLFLYVRITLVCTDKQSHYVRFTLRCVTECLSWAVCWGKTVICGGAFPDGCKNPLWAIFHRFLKVRRVAYVISSTSVDPHPTGFTAESKRDDSFNLACDLYTWFVYFYMGILCRIRLFLCLFSFFTHDYVSFGCDPPPVILLVFTRDLYTRLVCFHVWVSFIDLFSTRDSCRTEYLGILSSVYSSSRLQQTSLPLCADRSHMLDLLLDNLPLMKRWLWQEQELLINISLSGSYIMTPVPVGKGQRLA